MAERKRVKVEVELDRELVEVIRDRGLSLTTLVEDRLRAELVRPAAPANRAHDRLKEDIRAEIRSRNAMIEEDGLFGQEWRSI